MTTVKHGKKFREIAERSFQLCLRDVEMLRNKCRRVNFDFPKPLYAMKRDQLINVLLVDDFGIDAMMEYHHQCREWDNMKKFVEGK